MAILVALFLTALLVLTAFVVDLGYARQLRRQAQAAADASALAAAQEAFNAGGNETTGTAVAKTYVYSNLGVSPTTGWAHCSDPGALVDQPDAINSNTCISFDPGTKRARVRVPKLTMTTVFGRFAGWSSLTISASATAAIRSGGTCGLCLLSPAGQDLRVTMGGLLTINGDVVVDSVNNTQASPAANHSGGGAILVTNGTIGGPGAPGGFKGTYSPTPTTQPAVADPLTSLPLCSAAVGCPTAAAVDLNCSACGTLTSAVYRNLSISKSATLSPGIYVITGKFTASNSALLTMSGVTLYFACSNYPQPCAAGTSGGTFSFTGGGSLVLSPPDSGPYKGLSIFFDRNNTSGYIAPNGAPCAPNGPTITAGGSTSLDGTIYMPGACLKVTAGGATMGASIIASQAELTGGGAVTIDPSIAIQAVDSQPELSA